MSFISVIWFVRRPCLSQDFNTICCSPWLWNYVSLTFVQTTSFVPRTPHHNTLCHIPVFGSCLNIKILSVKCFCYRPIIEQQSTVLICTNTCINNIIKRVVDPGKVVLGPLVYSWWHCLRNNPSIIKQYRGNKVFNVLVQCWRLPWTLKCLDKVAVWVWQQGTDPLWTYLDVV